MSKLRVTIWNEFVHERENNATGAYIRKFYPDGIHRYLQQALAADDLEIRAVSLQDEAQGLPDAVLNCTDVLVWWGHCAHDKVEQSLAEKIAERVRYGMGFIALHSSHMSRVFRMLMGTRCRLHWREVGEKERLWCVDPSHPIAKGVPETFTLPHSEMYGERFDVPDDGKIIFMSWFEGGNVFRSGLAFRRDCGKVFYFSPGHETYPIYHDRNIQTILANAIRWCAPDNGIMPTRVTRLAESDEPIATPDPMADLDTSALHA